MGESIVSSVGELEEKINSAKRSLLILNENIRRFVGRGPKDLRGNHHKVDLEDAKNGFDDRQAHRHDFANSKRLQISKLPFNRLSSGDTDFRRRLNSRVIRELPSREEVVEAQGTDSESKARNRRMFGSLLGTLQKFCQEESKLKQKVDKKAQIEKKLENQELQERALLKKERECLFLDKKRKQFEIRHLEIKMSRLKDFKTWESSMDKQKHQIRTRTKPHIYFCPRIYSHRTEELLVQTQQDLDVHLAKKRDELHTELKILEKFPYIDTEVIINECSPNNSLGSELLVNC